MSSASGALRADIRFRFPLVLLVPPSGPGDIGASSVPLEELEAAILETDEQEGSVGVSGAGRRVRDGSDPDREGRAIERRL